MGGLSVLALWLFNFAPNYVEQKGFLLQADSIFQKMPLWIPAVLIVIIWIVISKILWNYIKKIFEIPIYTFHMVYAMIVSFSGLYLVVNLSIQRYIILLLTFCIFFFLYGMVRLDSEFKTHKLKSYRRVGMMLWAFICYAFSVIAYAIAIFFPIIPFWVIAVLLAVIVTFIMYEVLKMYLTISYKNNGFWFLIIGVFLFEIIWVIQLLPFSYITLGFFVAWGWYILQLLLRFHFSKTGIEWKKQQTFLLTNVSLFVMLLLLLKWR